jgi:hypothetical protein
MRYQLIALVVAASLGLVDRSQQPFDPKVRAKLEESFAAYRSLEALHIKVSWSARYTGSMSRDDIPLPGPDTLELRMQRPNKIYLEASSKSGERPSKYLIVSDGTNLWHWRSVPNTYTQVPAPPTLKELAKALPDNAIGTYDGSTWTVDNILEWDALVLDDDPIKEMIQSGLAASLSSERIGNELVDVIRLRGSESPSVPISTDMTYHLSGVSHLVRECRLLVRGKDPDNGRDFTADLRGVYDLINAKPDFTIADFQFTPPRGARLVKGK